MLSNKTLTVAVGTDWGPISHLDEKHELIGYDVDVAGSIAKYLGTGIAFVTPGWDIIAGGKWQGRWDVAMGQMIPTKARAEVFDFPALYIWGPNVAVVHKDSKDIVEL
ncbi:MULTISPECIES: transporter substrate-binding domain-containing protein [Rhizobium]|uniref:transporter substrate-binding domain-containing protein n=1 Tax=Rhizobium TaxID=379 RepID=UPI001EF7E1C9|nr:MULTISPECIES: transporter substrate-binding domain-containing protein [Rhizobium]ULJ82413.1 transporter substrate-binding domain-containing protein [Rhizobium sp. C104]